MCYLYTTRINIMISIVMHVDYSVKRIECACTRDVEFEEIAVRVVGIAFHLFWYCSPQIGLIVRCFCSQRWKKSMDVLGWVWSNGVIEHCLEACENWISFESKKRYCIRAIGFFSFFSLSMFFANIITIPICWICLNG